VGGDDRGRVVTDLHYISAGDAIARFTARELSPVELLDAVLARADAVEPSVNAMTEQLRDEAHAAARESERRYAGRGGPVRPLEGVPLALKEEQPIAGRTIEEGSLLEKGNVADRTHPVVERVLAAGAVVHARTTTPEFSCAPFTHTELWGVTRNPWNLDVSPGGSSGGAGASLASGSTVLATGSDIGGSIRIPSSFCGVVGFKAPFGRVPGLPPFNQDTYCADGPMGRSVADVARLQNVLAGPWSGDQASLRPAYRLPLDPEPPTGLRVALCIRLGDFRVEPEIERNTRAVAEVLRGLGVAVEEVELPWTTEEMMSAAWGHFGAIFGAYVNLLPADQRDLLMPYTRAFGEAAARHGDAATRLGGLVLEQAIYQPLGELLEGYDALLCPTVATYGIPAGEEFLDGGHLIDGEVVPWENMMMTIPFNVIGRVPVLSIPSGLGPNGVPTGVQLVGRTYDDATVFRLGAALESAQPRWADPAWRPGL
jgi:aspartyl-tRNA(Asn)/glutamyl-tRNA(Gln) amidotransferase subunit A